MNPISELPAGAMPDAPDASLWSQAPDLRKSTRSSWPSWMATPP